MIPTLWIAGGTAVVLAALIGSCEVQTGRLHTAQSELATEKTERKAEHDAADAAAIKADAEYRAREQQWATAQKEIADEADRKITQVRADAAIAAAAAGRLQQRVASLVAEARRAAANPGTASASAPASDPIDLLADLQRRADEAAGIMARVADERGAAGDACVSAYNALTEVMADAVKR
jgi:hypothetical protein